MKRRDFLRHAASSVTLPVVIDGFRAQAFARPASLMQALLGLTEQSDRVLVLIQLQGGNDGLNTVIPLDQMSVYTAANFRASIAIPEAKALRLKNYPESGLHPAMKGLHQLFGDGKVSIVQGVGYPSPDFSHFRASDIWMTGVDSNQTVASGWTGRYLDQRFPNYPGDYPNQAMPDPPAVQIGYVTATSLLGPDSSMAVVLQDPDTFARLVGDKPNNPTGNTGGYAGQQIDFIRQQQASSVRYADQIKKAAGKGRNLAAYPAGNGLAAQLKIIARLIHGGLQTKVYYLTLNGFDTHATQVDATDTTIGAHANLLRTLSDAVAAFQNDLGQLKLEDRVVGMTFSEFGRRAVANGSRGTDHGTSAPMFVFGTAVKNAMVGTNPDLKALENNNLRMQTDFRQVYAAILTDWFGTGAVDEAAVLFRNFPAAPVFRQVVTGVSFPATATRLYPNPASTEAILESDWLESGLRSVELADLSGRFVAVSAVRISPRTLSLAVGHLPVGSYFLRVETSRGFLTERLLIAR